MILRGEVYYADLSPVIGSEQGGVRPVLIIQNKYSPTIIVAAITSKTDKKKLPTHVDIGDVLSKESIVLLEQIRTIDKARLRQKIGVVKEEVMKKIDSGLSLSVGTM